MGQKNVLVRKIKESQLKQACHRDRDANIANGGDLPWSGVGGVAAVRLRVAIVAAVPVLDLDRPARDDAVLGGRGIDPPPRRTGVGGSQRVVRRPASLGVLTMTGG